MLSENGIVMDDGVFARLSDQHYLVNTTSANADRITGWLEHWHQCEWPDLDLIISPVTSQWAVATVAGPESRTLLQEMESDIDFSSQALPHMALACGTFLGAPARVQRVSFSGEMSFEISIPAIHGQMVMEALMKAGGDRIVPVGIEALIILRTEKGLPGSRRRYGRHDQRAGYRFRRHRGQERSRLCWKKIAASRRRSAQGPAAICWRRAFE